MVVFQPLNEEEKLQMTLKEVKSICEGRHDVYKDRSPCDSCMFHDKDGCSVEGMPKYWMEEE